MARDDGPLRACVFCGATDMAKRAHVLPQWIREIAPVRGPGERTVRVGGTSRTTPAGKLFNEHIRAICQKE